MSADSVPNPLAPLAAEHDSTRRAMLRAAGVLAAGATGLAALGDRAAGQQSTPAALQPTATRELYELRAYHLRTGPNVKRMTDYLRDALLPALKRNGAGPVGAFTVAIGEDSPTMHLLIPHRSMESVATMPDRLAADAEFRRAGSAVLDASSSDPAYDRLESSLLLAFAGMPKLEVPPPTAGGKRRPLFELRRYESHSERASQTKIELFNQSEIAIFKRHGMAAVFYGQSIIGARQPNLTYLLAFEDMREHDTQWSAFGSDPEFRALVAKPEFSDAAIVRGISNQFLWRMGFSEI